MRPPAFHYAEADRLAAELAEAKPESFRFPFVQAKVARAQIHASLAQSPWHPGIEGWRPASTFLQYAVGGDRCNACGAEIVDGTEILVQIRDGKPWLPEDDDDQTLPVTLWHRSCDKGSLAADLAEDQRRVQTSHVETQTVTSELL